MVMLFRGNAVAPIAHTLYGKFESGRLHVGTAKLYRKLYVGNGEWHECVELRSLQKWVRDITVIAV